MYLRGTLRVLSPGYSTGTREYQANRRTAETLMNKHSSRSHAVFTVTVHMTESGAAGEEVSTHGVPRAYLVRTP